MRRYRSMKSAPVVLHAVGTVQPYEVFDIDDDEADRLDPDFVEVGPSVPLGLPDAPVDDEETTSDDDPPVVDDPPEPRPRRGPGTRPAPADAGSTEETA